MSTKLKINSVIVFVLAAVFAVFFDFTKHNLYLSPINPFADDPYDAIGSFAFQAAALFGVLSLFRSFRPYRKGQPSNEQNSFLVRTQTATILCVLVALAGDIVAMIRHASLWSGVLAGNVLLIIVLTFSFLSIAIGVFVYNSAKGIHIPVVMNPLNKPAIISLIFFVVLFIYPEGIRQSIIGALFTVVVGAVLLFMPIWAWGEFLFPIVSTQSKTVSPKWVWVFVILTGVFLGFVIVLGELTVGGETLNLAGKAFVISVYIGLEVVGLVIGYSFLGKFLGIFRIFQELFVK